eukprot:6758376-Prymnesium_polylepis.1
MSVPSPGLRPPDWGPVPVRSGTGCPLARWSASCLSACNSFLKMPTVAQPYISHGLWGEGDAYDYIYQNLTHVISCDTQWCFSTPNQTVRVTCVPQNRTLSHAVAFCSTLEPR